MTPSSLTPRHHQRPVDQCGHRRAQGRPRGVLPRTGCTYGTLPALHHLRGPGTLLSSAPAQSAGHVGADAVTIIVFVLLTLALGGCGGFHPAHAPSPSLPAAAAYLQAIRHDPTIPSRAIDDAGLLRAGRSACQLAKSFNPDQAGYAALLLTVEATTRATPSAYERTLTWAARYLCRDQASFVASTLKGMHSRARSSACCAAAPSTRSGRVPRLNRPPVG